ncbi:MAG: ATP-binding protein [Thermoplasmatota archaeon]|nr:hypothetical protein [Halobacteriales archaeon]
MSGDEENVRLQRRLEREKKARLEAEAIAEDAASKLYGTVAALEQSNKALEHFAFIASHDLQEPLRKVTAFGSRLQEGYRGVLDERGRDYLARMVGAAARMRVLIDDLLAYSRITTKGNPFQEVDLGRVAQEVLGDLETRLQATQAKVEVGLLPTLVADPIQMRQLLQNLIGNALKYHKEGEPPAVKVTAEAPSSFRVILRVADNGIGFEQEQAERIFLPFQRLHGRDSKYEGTGIGLAIVQRIAERHGGSVRATSSPGAGATFTVELPRAPPRGPGANP